MHISSFRKQEIRTLTRVQWGKYHGYLSQWIEFHGECSEMAKFHDGSHAGIDFSNIPRGASYHDTCYQRFTDLKNKRLQVSQKRCNRAKEGTSELTAVSATLKHQSSPALYSNIDDVEKIVLEIRNKHVLPKTGSEIIHLLEKLLNDQNPA